MAWPVYHYITGKDVCKLLRLEDCCCENVESTCQGYTSCHWSPWVDTKESPETLWFYRNHTQHIKIAKISIKYSNLCAVVLRLDRETLFFSVQNQYRANFNNTEYRNYFRFFYITLRCCYLCNYSCDNTTSLGESLPRMKSAASPWPKRAFKFMYIGCGLTWRVTLSVRYTCSRHNTREWITIRLST